MVHLRYCFDFYLLCPVFLHFLVWFTLINLHCRLDLLASGNWSYYAKKNILPIPTTSPSKTLIDAKIMHAVLAGMISSSSHSLCAKVPLDLHTTTSWQTPLACSQTTFSDWVTNSPTCTSTGRYVAAASRLGFIFCQSCCTGWKLHRGLPWMQKLCPCWESKVVCQAWHGSELSSHENTIKSFSQGAWLSKGICVFHWL